MSENQEVFKSLDELLTQMNKPEPSLTTSQIASELAVVRQEIDCELEAMRVLLKASEKECCGLTELLNEVEINWLEEAQDLLGRVDYLLEKRGFILKITPVDGLEIKFILKEISPRDNEALRSFADECRAFAFRDTEF